MFDKVAVTTASADAELRQLVCLGYQTRMAMMKAAVSLAFKGIDDRYRVGYSTISERRPWRGREFVDIDTFGSSQKTLFYHSKLNAATRRATPLRGRSVQGRPVLRQQTPPGQTRDPVQYSTENCDPCRPTAAGTPALESSTYGPTDSTGPRSASRMLPADP